LLLTDVSREMLTREIYNISAFSLTAGQFRKRAQEAFPGTRVTFEPNPRRQGIVDSWPEDLDDSRAREDWGGAPDYDVHRFFDDYFLPAIRKRYSIRPSLRSNE
jgi:threonine 3-dehydrogenase